MDVGNLSKVKDPEFMMKMVAIIETVYYFKELFLRGPCCNGLTRHNTRNSREQKPVCRV